MVNEQVRRLLAEREASLSPFAAKSSTSRGRRIPEEPAPLRNPFQLDSERILHTNAFRRLKHKTQVFIAPQGDHYVTRLTHTLEVAHIARTIARALNLNEDLVEAIALGHDLGHTPFGHIGEETLNNLYPSGFKHAAQSLRLVDFLEEGGHGLNLTWEVRQGIVVHSKPRGDFLRRQGLHRLTLEAQLCRLADAVAYVNHDITDAVRAGVVKEEELPREAVRVVGQGPRARLDTLLVDIVEHSWAATGETTLAEGERPLIAPSPRVHRSLTILREFLFERVYEPLGRGHEAQKAREVLALLYRRYSAHPETLPGEYARHATGERRVADYIAGMTDYFALRAAEHLQAGISSGVRFMGL